MDIIASSAAMRPSAIMAESENRTFFDKFMLRLPDGMRERIKLAAEKNNRSMNAEIVATLDERYPTPKNSATERLVAAMRLAVAHGKPIDMSQELFEEMKSALEELDGDESPRQ